MAQQKYPHPPRKTGKPAATTKKDAHPSKKSEARPPLRNIFLLFAAFFVFFIPVFYYKDAMDITLMPRLLVVSGFLAIMSVLLLRGKNLATMDFTPLRSALFPVTAAYLLITIISVVWAVNPRESYFDMVRTSMFLWVLLFATLIFRVHEGWQEKLPKFISVATLLAVVIGLVQYFEKVVNGPSVLEDGREAIYGVVGVMSHKNEFSNALMLMLPFLVYGVYSLRKEWRWLSAIALIMNLVMILLLKTRSVWVGVAIGAIVTGMFLVFAGHRVKFHRAWRIGIGAVIFLAVAGISYIYSLPKKPDDFSFTGRIQNITDLNSPHNISRLNVWKATLQMIHERPFYEGVGAGNWQLLIAPYCKGMFSSISALNWGRPHNDFLWVWAEKGVFGLILYLAMFFLGFFYLFRVFFFSPHTRDRMLALLIAGGILGYLSISFFSFPYERVNHTVYLALYFAAAMVLHHRAFPRNPLKVNTKLLLAGAILMNGFGVIYGYHAVKMEVNMKRTIQAEKQNRFEVAIDYAQKSMNPFRSLNPMAYPPEYYVAKSDAALGRDEQALEGFRKTLELFPGNVWTISRMGLIYSKQKQYDSLITCLTYITDLVPDLRQERKALASAWFQKGEYMKAIEELKKIPNYKKDKEVIRNIKYLEDMIEKEKVE